MTNANHVFLTGTRPALTNVGLAFLAAEFLILVDAGHALPRGRQGSRQTRDLTEGALLCRDPPIYELTLEHPIREIRSDYIILKVGG